MPTILLRTGRKAKVSQADLGFLSKWRWTDNGKYAFRGTGWTSPRIWMHRVILERMGHDIEGLEGDHINFDKLDNRRSNLRPLTTAENKSRVNPGRGAKISAAKRRRK